MTKNKKLIRAGIVSAGLGLFHYILHTLGNLEFINVGYFLIGGYFLWSAFLEDKVFGRKY